ncbi:MAG TPA: 3-phosphoshikimate 1-carboxyvinyltransferase [Dongiaceae bacterium]|nr:3-phosphoshikimate 1-carboxyvinyltransferase [Dongiaceae bacterium]
MRAEPCSPLTGSVRVPGDKSISHRALMFGALAVGETRIQGLLEGEDVLATARAMRALGAEVHRDDDGLWRVRGRGVGGLAEAEDVIDCGNAGTATRLLMGLVATQPLLTFFTGDNSLRRRPMARVMEPLTAMGASFIARDGARLPLAVRGTGRPVPLDYILPVASAQVKSAILLAGLNCRGETHVLEPELTRDHTELMLRHFGAEITIVPEKIGRRIILKGQPELCGREIHVPGDISSAAFPLVAALLVPNSTVTISDVGLNPHRTGLLASLQEMGADIAVENERMAAGERIGDLVVTASALRGITVPAARAPSMIDEYPILFVAASFAEGTSFFPGLGELRVKESDRLGAMARGLSACGVTLEEGEDWLRIHGTSQRPRGAADIAVNLDHRVAMSFLVLGLAAQQPVAIDDAATIGTSFPGFVETMARLGAIIG